MWWPGPAKWGGGTVVDISCSTYIICLELLLNTKGINSGLIVVYLVFYSFHNLAYFVHSYFSDNFKLLYCTFPLALIIFVISGPIYLESSCLPLQLLSSPIWRPPSPAELWRPGPPASFSA